MTEVVQMPHLFEPREYQKPIFNALMNEDKKRFIMVAHRRSGKDKTCLNLIATYLCMTPNQICFYIYPTRTMAKLDVWDQISSDGVKFLDHFPKQMLASKPNNSELKVKLKNGSSMQLVGAHKFDNIVGSNPSLIIFAEYSLQNPLCWEYMRPVLVENKGKAIFQFTPRGRNFAYRLYEKNKNNPDWFVQLLTVEDTKRADGTPVITQEAIQEEREAGVSEEKILQEFYCSFDAALEQAYFAKQLLKATQEGRVSGFAHPEGPVHTFWDKGRDQTAIWFAKFVGDKIYLIDFYARSQETMPHFVNYMENWKNKHEEVFGIHFLPHDAAHKDYYTGLSLQQRCDALGFKMEIVPRVKEKTLAIEWARSIFKKCWFDPERCALGLDALKAYQPIINQATGMAGKPKHDFASHGADAFQGIAQALQDNRLKAKIWGQQPAINQMAARIRDPKQSLI